MLVKALGQQLGLTGTLLLGGRFTSALILFRNYPLITSESTTSIAATGGASKCFGTGVAPSFTAAGSKINALLLIQLCGLH